MQPSDTTHTDKTILIFEKPENYFFPYYDGSVFAPFGVPQPGFLYAEHSAAGLSGPGGAAY